jgi:putative N6-adenine-specific DNA methylase
MKLELVATCLFGLEKLLGEEIDALGLRRLDTMDGRITFEGELIDVARCNLHLRCAEHVFIRLGSFQALTYDELFEGVKALPWENWIGKYNAFPVKGHSIKSKLYSVPDCQSIIKKAIVDRLSGQYGLKWFAETEACYQVEFFLFKDTVSLMIDTSGMALHKRGYRPQSMPAPLRETLAAAMVKIARPREDVLLHDPFCGSGTIPIEAAMLMSNTAPGLFRSFAAEDFDFIPKEIWESVREEAKNAIRTDCTFEAYASDIDPDAVRNAELCVKKAGMEKYIKVFLADALTITTGDRRGTVVCNPPYGERLGTIKEAETLYKKMGKQFATLGAWQIYVLTSSESFERLYGRRADKVRKLYNGMLPCYYYQFFKKQNTEKHKK